MKYFIKLILPSFLLIGASLSIASASAKATSFELAQVNSKPERIFADGSFKLELQGCNRNPTKEVICNFIITNLSKEEKKFPITTNLSQATDSFGNRYSPAKWTISNQGPNGTLMPDISTPITVSYAVKSKIDSFAVLYIGNFYQGGIFRFSNIEIKATQPVNSSEITSSTVNKNNPDNWLTMGKTNDGNIVSLDVNSIQNQSINSLKFHYRITDNTETRERIGITDACRNGQISLQPEWKIEFQDEALVIEANSPGSINLLKTVCLRTANNHQ